LTPEDQELDPRLLTGKPLTLYRIAKGRYANLSGTGAAIFPGRWNHPGEEAIYTSTDRATPILERLVHTPDKDLIPSNLACMTIHVTGDWVADRDCLADPATGAIFEIHKTLSYANSKFYRKRPSGNTLWTRFALAVPSVIVPVWNVVLFPRGLGFWKHVSLAAIEPFEFDPRLFNKDATGEPSQPATS
jgi:RES domain-containing protein